MNNKILLFWISLLLVSSSGFTETSFKRCVLLPVISDGGTEDGNELYSELDERLKKSKWCFYRPDKSILTILEKYKDGLKEYFNNPTVLKLFATRNNAGSVIRVETAFAKKGVYVEVVVFGENGVDIYFKDRAYLEGASHGSEDLIASTVIKKLDEYNELIPYDGIVKSVFDGEQITFVHRDAENIQEDAEIQIIRKTRVIKNPALKHGVEWQTENVGGAQVVGKSDFQVYGKSRWAEMEQRAQVGDWVKLLSNKSDKKKYIGIHQYKKRGKVILTPIVGKGRTTVLIGGSRKQVSGFTMGAALHGDIWFWNYTTGVILDFDKRVGYYAKKYGTLTTTSKSTREDQTAYRGALGYRYFPSGYFYGPKIILQLGYKRYKYSTQYAPTDGLGACSFSGILTSVTGDFPVADNFHLYTRFDYLPSASYEEDYVIFGEATSVTSYQFELGAKKMMSPATSFDGGIQLTSNKASFDSPVRDIRYEDISLKTGFVLYF